MTRLNHKRPSLRYLDNLRRELSKRPTLADLVTAPMAGTAVVKRCQTVRTCRPQNRPAFNRHIETFDQLKVDQQRAIGALIEHYARYQEASSLYLQYFLTPRKSGKMRKAREAARLDLAQVGADYILQCVRDAAAMAPGVLEWLARLKRLMTRDERREWEELNEILITESAPMAEARLGIA